ncbi:hypothetical protein K505DRAFT_383713 [Melanomma pulvis-pyrius CBS 109.77]|uniref:Uncharacterized protein n=1 Tax=Melanomma pulvis-pyrius CBS 109.77 TaxID=1314802 RepID=A0A6A6XE71_9PLEO|nr:hypothetical protein K505DRAFT_383713 [Melanomma pulvis-pyrius CBS 109.77]
MEQDIKKRKRNRKKKKGSSGVAKQRATPPVATQNESPSPGHIKQSKNIKKRTKRRRERKRRSTASVVFSGETYNHRNEVFCGNLEPPKKKQETDTFIEATCAHAATFTPLGTRVKPPTLRVVPSHCQIVERASAYTTLEQRTAETSPLLEISAVPALEVLKSRIGLLQSNIDMCQTRLRNAQEVVDTLPPKHPRCDTLLKRIGIFERVIGLALEHFTELFVQEQWLRDLFDHQSGGGESSVRAYGQRATDEIGIMKRLYDERLFPLLLELSPETMACTAEQIIKERSEGGDHGGDADMREEEEGVDGIE